MTEFFDQDSEPRRGAAGAVDAPTHAPDEPDALYDEPEEYGEDASYGDDPHDYVELSPHSSGGRKALVVIGVLVVMLLAVVGTAYFWYDHQVNPGGKPGPIVDVDIPTGATTSGIGPLLARNKVIVSDTVWGVYISQHSPPPLQAGHYKFHQHSSYGDVLKVLKAGPLTPTTVRVTFPEGFRLAQIEARLVARVPQIRQKDLDAVLASGQLQSQFAPAGVSSLEGLLFPATYDISTNDDAGSVLRNMVSTMDGTLGDLGVATGAPALASRAGRPLTPYEVVIVASLVQSEAGSVQEMPKVAAVIYNRLRIKMALGIDATSRYESLIKGTAINFNSASSYNTRREVGLPPTPISSPGRDALYAALHPDPGNWLYYVLQAPHVHFFTSDPAAFDHAVHECHVNHLGC